MKAEICTGRTMQSLGILDKDTKLYTKSERDFNRAMRAKKITFAEVRWKGWWGIELCR